MEVANNEECLSTQDSRIVDTRDIHKSYADRKEETRERQHEMLYSSALDKEHAVQIGKTPCLLLLRAVGGQPRGLVACPANWTNTRLAGALNCTLIPCL